MIRRKTLKDSFSGSWANLRQFHDLPGTSAIFKHFEESRRYGAVLGGAVSFLWEVEQDHDASRFPNVTALHPSVEDPGTPLTHGE